MECAPWALPPPPMVIAGMPRLIGILESVEPARVAKMVMPAFLAAARAFWTMGSESGGSAAGRRPITLISRSRGALEFGQRCFSASMPY